jgi:hypothetical protein
VSALDPANEYHRAKLQARQEQRRPGTPPEPTGLTRACAAVPSRCFMCDGTWTRYATPGDILSPVLAEGPCGHGCHGGAG